jgi:hypothetical protein
MTPIQEAQRDLSKSLLRLFLRGPTEDAALFREHVYERFPETKALRDRVDRLERTALALRAGVGRSG